MGPGKEWDVLKLSAFPIQWDWAGINRKVFPTTFNLRGTGDFQHVPVCERYYKMASP